MSDGLSDDAPAEPQAPAGGEGSRASSQGVSDMSDGLSDDDADADPEARRRNRRLRREEKVVELDHKVCRTGCRTTRSRTRTRRRAGGTGGSGGRRRKQQEELKDKLQRLESKVLVGGENLLDKAESQRALLEQASRELERRRLIEQKLSEDLIKKEVGVALDRDSISENLLDKAESQRALLEQASRELERRRLIEQKLSEDLIKKEAERLDLEERYSSLQEENAAKTRKLKRAVQLLNSAKAELADQQREQQREMEGILDSVRALKREIQLADLVLDEYIPKDYQALIDQYVHWNEQLGEWQVKCVAYTGNNMNLAQDHAARHQRHKHMEPPDLSDRYLSYSSAPTRAPSRLAPPTAVPRPHTAYTRAN
ncbi:hypothetical protein JYU34_018279 [Plutella xylostella]|uniref:Uncharacterized protein n=1 Tax=Plutella xylostella TaxID=51655 RepID=A0ABQ7Q071_PLUXY|nr:hypothetical protein JYU34_018279 [Plutella xylostella]